MESKIASLEVRKGKLQPCIYGLRLIEMEDSRGRSRMVKRDYPWDDFLPEYTELFHENRDRFGMAW